jgi:hypothetical protein
MDTLCGGAILRQGCGSITGQTADQAKAEPSAAQARSGSGTYEPGESFAVAVIEFHSYASDSGNMKRYSLLVLSTLGVVAFPQCAWANAGTPLMWAGMYHLLFGNALIGVGEGLLLAWLFSLPKVKSVFVMIIANYASAWLGGLFLCSRAVGTLPMDLNNGWTWFWVMVVATYCMTLLLEWPFIVWCFRGKADWLRRSVKASFVIQSASYVLLFGWYWMASSASIYTQMDVVKPADLSLPGSVMVYFIASADGNVYRRSLVGTDEQKVFDLHSTDRNDRLFVRPNKTDISKWDLVARLETKNHRDARFVDLLTNMQVEVAPDWRRNPADPPGYYGTGFNFGPAQAIGDATNSPWEFRTGFWPIEGLRASNKMTSEHISFSFETPFGAWNFRNAVQLPSDKLLFQLGDDQICAFDPVQRRVALLWHGRGPVPVIDKVNAEQGGLTNRNGPMRAEVNQLPDGNR